MESLGTLKQAAITVSRGDKYEVTHIPSSLSQPLTQGRSENTQTEQDKMSNAMNQSMAIKIAIFTIRAVMNKFKTLG